MAILTSCFFNRPPATSKPSSHFEISSLPPTTPKPIIIPPNPSSQVEIAWAKKEKSWRSQCVSRASGIIIAVELANLLAIQQHAIAIAEDMHSVAQPKLQIERWSDQRSCPPWHINSLETIVPENLPRPSAHRRWEAVKYAKAAPPVEVITGKIRTKCFAM